MNGKISVHLTVLLLLWMLPATCVNNWSIWHAVRGRLLLLLHPMSAGLPNPTTSRAVNVDWWWPSSIQPELI